MPGAEELVAMFLFGQKKKDPKEVMRENQRALKRNEREIEREAMQMKRQEQQILTDIKKAAKEGNMAVAKTLAKQLVRVRQTATRTTVMKAQVKGVGASMSVAASQGKMVEAMGKAGAVMGQMNEQMDAKAMAKILNEFQQEGDKMEVKQELMDDALDGIFDDDGMEEEADEVTQQVLEELNLDMMGRMGEVAKGKLPAKQAVADAAQEDEDAELEARLAALRA